MPVTAGPALSAGVGLEPPASGIGHLGAHAQAHQPTGACLIRALPHSHLAFIRRPRYGPQDLLKVKPLARLAIVHRGVEEQAGQKEGPFRHESVEGRELEIALIEEQQVGLVAQGRQVVRVAIIRHGAGGVRQKHQFTLLVVIRRLELAIGGGGIAPRAGEDGAQFLANIPTRAVHEQDAGKWLE